MKTINTIEAMRLFVAVAETGGFSSAARRQRTQQSTVSRVIASLEKDYRTTFFQRTTRSLTITEAGRTYLSECRRILNDIDQLAKRMQRIQETPEGQLRINLPIAFGGRVVVRTLGEFKKKYPGIHLEVHLEDRAVNIVSEGFDVVVRVGPSEDSTVASRKLCVIRRGLYVAKHLQQRLGPIRSPDDLTRYPGVIFAGRTPSRPKWTLSRGSERRTIPISEITTVNHLDSLDTLVRQGLGVGCLPHYFNPKYPKVGHDSKVEQILPDWEISQELGQSSTVYLLFPKGQNTNAKVRAFVDFLLEKITAFEGEH